MIQALFEKHAISNRMGLIVENESHDFVFTVEEHWEAQELQFPANSYKVSLSLCPPEQLNVGIHESGLVAPTNFILGLLID